MIDAYVVTLKCEPNVDMIAALVSRFQRRRVWIVKTVVDPVRAVNNNNHNFRPATPARPLPNFGGPG